MVQATKFTVDPAWRIILKDLGLSEDEVLRRAFQAWTGQTHENLRWTVRRPITH